LKKIHNKYKRQSKIADFSHGTEFAATVYNIVKPHGTPSPPTNMLEIYNYLLQHGICNETAMPHARQSIM